MRQQIKNTTTQICFMTWYMMIYVSVVVLVSGHNIVKSGLFLLSHLTQTCSAPCIGHLVLCIFERKADILDISISLFPRLLSQPRFLYGIWCPLRFFFLNEHWHLRHLNHNASLLQHCTLRKSFFNYCHYFLPQPSQPPRTRQTICSAERKCDIFSSTVTGEK